AGTEYLVSDRSVRERGCHDHHHTGPCGSWPGPGARPGQVPRCARDGRVPGDLRRQHRVDARERGGGGRADGAGLPADPIPGAGGLGDGAVVSALSHRRRAAGSRSGPVARAPGPGGLRPGQRAADRVPGHPGHAAAGAARAVVRRWAAFPGLSSRAFGCAARGTAARPPLHPGPGADQDGGPVSADRGLRRGRPAACDRAPRGALIADALSFVASGLVLRFGLAARPAPADRRGSMARDSLTGLREVLAHRPIRRILLFGWLVAACVIAPEALAAPYAAYIGQPARVAGF